MTTNIFSRLAAIGTFGTLSALAPCRASVVSTETQLDLLRRVNNKVLIHLAEAPKPNASGAIGGDLSGFIQVGLQNESAWIVPDALIRQDPAALDRALRIVEYSFAHMQPDGSFEFHVGTSGTADTTLSRAGSAAFFYADLGQTLCLIDESTWFEQANSTATLRSRVRAIKDDARRGLPWFEGQAHALVADRTAVNRSLNYALAYYLVGKSLKRRKAMTLGLSFLNNALSRQTADGTFPEAGGFDSSYQGVSLYLAQILYLELQTKDATVRARLWDSIVRGIAREDAAIDEAGTISTVNNTRVRLGGERLFGVTKHIDGRSVSLGLLYYAALSMNARVNARAMAVARRYSMTKI